MLVDHIISGICNLRIGKVILIGDSTTLLDYRHQFTGSLLVVDSRSQTQVSSRCNFIGYWSLVDFL